MIKKTAVAALFGLTTAMSAQAFTIMAGDYKMTVDGYDNGTLYSGSGLICGSVGACDSASGVKAVGATGSEDSWGILSIASIVYTPTNTQYFTRGTDGYIIGSFTGLTDRLAYVDSFTGAQTTFSVGGVINLYLSSTNYDPSIDSSGQAAVLTSVQNSPLWLGLQFVTGVNNSADGLISSYRSTFDTNGFTGSGNGFLSVTGGSAADKFDSDFYSTYAGNVADAYFSVTINPLTQNDAGYGNWLAGPTMDVRGHAIPEPASMALAGLGLLGLAGLRRRKQQA